MYHPRFKGNHYLMGQKMGNIFKKANAKFPVKLDGFQKQFGKESGLLLNRFFPEAALEIKGITDVIDLDYVLFTSWMMCMGCCLDIDDGESVEVRGCTAFSFVHKGNVYYGRDNDLPPFLKPVSKSIYYQPENGNRFILNTSSFINGEEGINDSGLVVAMTFVVPKLNEIKPGFNSVFIVRYLLEKCKTVNEGLDALNKLPIASSCNILLVDKSRKMVVAECNPQEIHLRYPEKNKNNEDFIITVNHFTSNEMWMHDASNRNVFLSENRYQTAYDALVIADYTDGIKHAEDILSGKFGFMCQYDQKLNFDTIWSSVFDITNDQIFRAEDNPMKAKYIQDKRLFDK
jgi:predicted choloylglycine hydrolase